DGTRIDTFTGHIGKDGISNVGASDVDLYKVNLTTRGDLTVKLSTLAGGKLPIGSVLRFFDSGGIELGSNVTTLPGIWASLHTAASSPLDPGLYFVGVSAPGNTTYDVGS